MEGPGPQPEPTREDTPEHRMPGWVRGFVIVGILLVVIGVLAMALSSGGHGPSRHVSGGGEGQVAPAEGDGHRPPVEHP